MDTAEDEEQIPGQMTIEECIALSEEDETEELAPEDQKV